MPQAYPPSTRLNSIPPKVTLIFILSLVLGACGGGSGGDPVVSRSSSSSNSSNSSASSSPSGVWTEGVFPDMNQFWDLCESPRSGIDPYTNQAYWDTQGSTLDENNLLRSLSNELYLWYNEIPDRDPELYTTADYFTLLKTTAITPTGTPKDQFHWSQPTEDFNNQLNLGQSAGYGASWALLSSTPPREAVVVLTQPNSPISAPGVNISRGARILSIDGIDLVNDNTQNGIDTLNAGLFPQTIGETHTFVFQELNSSTTRSVQITSELVTESPVNTVSTLNTATGNVGYILFNSHTATSETGLLNAFTDLTAAGVSDLILDLRYNGGGYLDIASELGYMVAGTQTNNKIFETTLFNDKHTTIDPFSGNTITPIDFHSTTQGFSETAGISLPTLNLDRLYVLTGSNTCSASESIINSLRGVGVEVIQIGGTTCGKPYGAVTIDNCGTTYFTIQFKGANDQGYGDYTDGFFPGVANSSNPAELPGCEVADDYNHVLGDVDEARLSAALYHRDTGNCPNNGIASTSLQKITQPAKDGIIRQQKGLGDKILRSRF